MYALKIPAATPTLDYHTILLAAIIALLHEPLCRRKRRQHTAARRGCRLPMLELLPTYYIARATH
jgi:hypothetical protein